ncbi:MAG: SRPBCC family protein [Saprospiraceae bacterium]
MKFTCTVIIEKPINQVAELFIDPENLKEYQDGFLRKKLVSGTPAQVGTISKMFYQQGKRTMEITETVTSNNLPHEFTGFYHHIHMDNTMTNRFTALSEDRTQYDAEVEYTVLRGFMVKAMAFLFPGMFKKQVQKWLDQFKVFVEKQ